MLDNGSFYGAQGSRPNWDWYDEYDLAGTSNTKWLGAAVDGPQLAPWSNGVYRREFQNGLVLVNPLGNGTRTVNVGAGWRRFQGTQDPVHNNGQAASSITLEAQDAILLVRVT